MKRLLLTLVLALFLISFASAQLDDLGTFKVSDCVTIKQVCSSCSYVNITVSYPNSTLAISNNNMSSQGAGTWIYNFCSTPILGRYDVTGEGDILGVATGFNSVYFEVTTTGESLDIQKSILYIILTVGIFAIFLITLGSAFAFPWKNQRDEEGSVISINDLKYVKVVLFALAYLEFLFIITILKNLSGFVLSGGTQSFLNIIFTFMLIGLIPFFPLLIFITAVNWLNDKKVLKKIQRGIPVK